VDKSNASRLGGLTTFARHDPREHLKPAWRGFLARFEREVDPDGVLEPAERARRAENARRIYMIRLAEKSRQARAERARPT
jgi:hypothetical protein